MHFFLEETGCLNGKPALCAEMALRLEKVFGQPERAASASRQNSTSTTCARV
jgi:plasmid maintenance system antidote protein VapI